jgi:protein-disulfide isomerase
MANKRVETGGGRKSGVVKKSSTSNRAFYLIIGAVAVLGIGALTYQTTRPDSNAVVSPIDTTLPSVKSSGYQIGNADAPLQVTEFGDFECPACGRFAELTEPDIRKNYVNTGKVLWRFIDFPLQMHRNTWQASRAAACADEQGKFWEFHDALYSTQDQWNGEATGNPDKFMKQLGGKLGLDGSKFNSCVDDKKTQAKIQAHYQLAMQRQVSQTPTFLIGDQQIAAAMPYDEFAKILDSALAKAAKAPAVRGGDTAKGITIPAPKKGQ